MKTPQVPALDGMTPLGIKPQPVTQKEAAAFQAKMIQAVLNGPALPGSKQIDPAHVAKVFSFHIVRA